MSSIDEAANGSNLSKGKLTNAASAMFSKGYGAVRLSVNYGVRVRTHLHK